MTGKLIDATVPKFIIVGIINTVIGAGTMFMLYNWLHCSYWFSSAANYIVGGFVSFFLNKYFTFQNKKWVWGQVIKFMINLLLCYLVAYSIAREAAGCLLVSSGVAFRENVAMLLGICLYTLLNYIGQRSLIFR